MHNGYDGMMNYGNIYIMISGVYKQVYSNQVPGQRSRACGMQWVSPKLLF